MTAANLRSVRSHEPLRASSAAFPGRGCGDADAVRSSTPVSSSRWAATSRRCYCAATTVTPVNSAAVSCVGRIVAHVTFVPPVSVVHV